MNCCFCKVKIMGYGNNPRPLTSLGRCCDNCNLEHVIPARMISLKAIKNYAEEKFPPEEE